jgi:hypothetical protein
MKIHFLEKNKAKGTGSYFFSPCVRVIPPDNAESSWGVMLDQPKINPAVERLN